MDTCRKGPFVTFSGAATDRPCTSSAAMCGCTRMSLPLLLDDCQEQTCGASMRDTQLGQYAENLK